MDIATFFVPLAVKGGVKVVKLVRVKRNGEPEPLQTTVHGGASTLTAEYGYIPRVIAEQPQYQPAYRQY